MIQLIGGGILVGLVAILAAPAVLSRTSHGSTVGNWFATVAMQTLTRPSISISPATDFALRRRSFDEDYGHESISASGKTKRVTKIPGSIQRWGGRPFTFVDERFGNTFDLRDVLIGSVEHEHKKDGDMFYQEYEYGAEGSLVNLRTYVRAFFELDEPEPLNMDLGESIHPITDGSEDASAWERVYEGVKRMFSPYQDPVGILKLMLPMLALVGGFFAGFYLFGPGMLPGEQSSGRPVAVGASLLLLGGSADRVREIAGAVWSLLRAAGGRVIKATAAAGRATWSFLRSVPRYRWLQLAGGIVSLSILAGALLIAPTATVILLVATVTTVLLIPLGSATIISALPAALAEPIAEMWMTLGLKGFSDPIVHQLKNGSVRVDEAADLGYDDDGPRYRFCKAWVGFITDADAEAFGTAAVTGSKLSQFRSTAVPDGGETLPDDVEPTDRISNADHSGFLPTFDALDRRRRNHTFVRTDRWLGRFADASTGSMTERAQQQGTKDFAGGEPAFSDRQIMLFSFVAMALGLVVSLGLWGL